MSKCSGSVGNFVSSGFDTGPASRDTQALVTDLIGETGTLAIEAQDRALRSIERLGDFALDIELVHTPSIPVPTLHISPIGTAPAEPPNLTTNFATAPLEPTLSPVSTITIEDPPEFLDSAPLLLDIPIPDPLSAVLPVAPSLTDVDIPVSPDYVLPDVPVLAAFNLPDAPVIDLPVFDAEVGTLPIAPDTEFAWAEVEYSTNLLAEMNTKLLAFVQGDSTGLDPLVEAAIYNRARDRQAEITQGSIDEANRNIASKGFRVPNGVLVRIVQQALQERLQKDSDISRDIMIKQAELEQSNFQFAFTTAVQLESRLLDHFNAVQGRAFEAEKFTFQALIDIFNAKVSLFEADVKAFGVKVEIFKSRLQAELARLDIYKAELEGQKLISELNESQVKVYTAQIGAVSVIVDIFKSQVEAAKVEIDGQKSKVDVYRAQLQGYESQVSAKTSEFQGYATRIQAEATKVDMYGTQAQAFKSRIDAYSALVTAKLGEQEITFKQLQEFPIEIFKQRIAAHQSNVQAEAARVEAVANVFKTRVDAFVAEEGAKSTNIGAQVAVLEATTNVAVEQSKLAIQASQTNTQLALSASETAQASLRAAGQLAGQLAAAALAARNVSASLSSSDSFGDSRSTSSSESTSKSSSCSDSFSDVVVTTVDGGGT